MWLLLVLSAVDPALPEPREAGTPVLQLGQGIPVYFDARLQPGFAGTSRLSRLVAGIEAFLTPTQGVPRPLDEAELEACRDRLEAEQAVLCPPLVALQDNRALHLVALEAYGRGPRSRLQAGWLDLDRVRGWLPQSLRREGAGSEPDARRALLRDLATAVTATTAWSAPRVMTAGEPMESAVAEVLAEARSAVGVGPELFPGPELLLHLGEGVRRVRIDGAEHLVVPPKMRVRGLGPGLHEVAAIGGSGFAELPMTVFLPEAGGVDLRLDVGPRRPFGWDAALVVGGFSLVAATGVGLYAVVDADRPGATPDGGPILAGLTGGLAVLGSGLLLAQWARDERRDPVLEVVVALAAAGAATVAAVELYEGLHGR